MDSEVKTGSTEEEPSSMLSVAQEKVGDAIMAKWERAERMALKLAKQGGIPEEHLESFLKAFEIAYFRGAIDISEINPSQLPLVLNSKVH